MVFGGWLTCMMLAAPLWAQIAKAKRNPRPPAVTHALPAELEKAEEAIAAQQYAVAEPLLLAEIKREPRDFRAWYDLGFVYQQTDRPQEALKAYKQSIAADATIAKTFAALGALEHRLGQDQDALQHLRQAAQLEPKNSDLWMQLAELQAGIAPQDAIQSYAQAATLSPHDPEPHLRAARILSEHDVDGAIREYKAAVDRGATAALPSLAELYQSSGNSALAVTTMRSYLSAHAEDTQAHERLAHLLVAQGDRTGALAELESVARMDPKNAHARKAIGGLQLEAKRFAEAEQAFRAALAVSPQDADAHYGLATALNSQHHFEAAEQEFSAALAIDPKLVDAYGGLALAASKNHHPDVALQALDARSRLAAENAATLFLRATSLDTLQQYELAADSYHRFLTASNGAYPDQEWQARHRLVAIEPEGKKKKK